MRNTFACVPSYRVAWDLQPGNKLFITVPVKFPYLPLAALLAASFPASAQQPGDSPSANLPSQELLLLELDRRRPDEMSPFFANREVERLMSSPEGRRMVENQGVAVYPNTATYDSVDRIFGSFFRGMFRSVRIAGQPPMSLVALEVTPGTTFLLESRREIGATFAVSNRTRKLMRLDFPSGQRFDLILRDASGTILERWSDDRAFEEREGVVMINPDEKIEYSGSISTRDMKAGEKYLLEGTLSGNPEFTQTVVLDPQ